MKIIINKLIAILFVGFIIWSIAISESGNAYVLKENIKDWDIATIFTIVIILLVCFGLSFYRKGGK